MKKSKKRKGKRKPVSLIEVCEITSMSHYIVIAETGSVINASSSGLLIEIHRKDFLTEDLKGTLNLDHRSQACCGTNALSPGISTTQPTGANHECLEDLPTDGRL